MPKVRLSIVFESGARIGPGKAALLESIRDTGSISAAAREMGMDYKRAWTLSTVIIGLMNQAFTQPVVSTASGGAKGGGATLTAFGADVLGRYSCAVGAQDLETQIGAFPIRKCSTPAR
jgi:molybdate transport system regulatory protein